MRICLLGRYYEFRRVPKSGMREGGDHGECDPPSRPAKEIRVYQALTGKEELETILHEFLHACDFSKDELWVDIAARDVARILWKFGYRKNDR